MIIPVRSFGILALLLMQTFTQVGAGTISQPTAERDTPDHLVDRRIDLGSVLITGGTNDRQNKTMVPAGDVARFDITPNSLGVVFIADKTTDEQFELFCALIDGSTSPLKFNPTLPTNGDVPGLGSRPTTCWWCTRPTRMPTMCSNS